MSKTPTPAEAWAFCDAILPDVSRSFALIIPQCPPPVNQALCVGYLICRVADTIEDEASLDDGQRRGLYEAFLSALDEPADARRCDAMREAWPALPDGPYGELIEHFDYVLAAYRALPEAVRTPLWTCARDMVAGMRRVRPVETVNGVAFMCRDIEDLERYCHHVAGTVGIMSTALFEMRFDPAMFAPTDAWREDGRRLGLALQMTNIIKDCRVDAERGVSYVPVSCVDLSAPDYCLSSAGRAKLLDRAIGHLDAGFRYTLAVPAGEKGIRTFLLGSLLPAVATLEVAATGGDHHPKITRARMAEILSHISQHVADDAALRDGYAQCRTRLTQCIRTH